MKKHLGHIGDEVVETRALVDGGKQRGTSDLVAPSAFGSIAGEGEKSHDQYISHMTSTVWSHD